MTRRASQLVAVTTCLMFCTLAWWFTRLAWSCFKAQCYSWKSTVEAGALSRMSLENADKNTKVGTSPRPSVSGRLLYWQCNWCCSSGGYPSWWGQDLGARHCPCSPGLPPEASVWQGGELWGHCGSCAGLDNRGPACKVPAQEQTPRGAHKFFLLLFIMWKVTANNTKTLYALKLQWKPVQITRGK